MRINERLDAEAADWWPERDNPAVREKIITHYLQFAERLASTGARQNEFVSYDECLSCAHYGLIQAVDRFNPAEHASFTSFATWRVTGAIRDAAREHDWVPHGARSDSNAGGRELPLMLPLDNQDFETTQTIERHMADLGQIEKFVKPQRHRQMVRDVIEHGYDGALKLETCTECQFARVFRWAVNIAQAAYERQSA